MTLIASENYATKRIHLSIDSVGVDINPIDIYKEHRARRRLNAHGERDFLPMVSAFGNEQIGPSKSTPRFTDLSGSVKIVPYDTSHVLSIVGSLISTEDQLEGRDLFDRSSLLSSVDVDYRPPQVEIIQVSTGSGLSSAQDQRLSQLHQTLISPGVFSTAALANVPAGSGGGGSGGLTQAQVREALGMASANLDAQLADIPTQIRTELSTELARIDTNIESRASTNPDNAGISTLLTRLTELRAEHLDKLNVSGTLAHSDAASTYFGFGSSDRTALLALPTLVQIEASTILAKEATVALLPNSDAISLAVESQLQTDLDEIKSAAISGRNLAAAGL